MAKPKRNQRPAGAAGQRPTTRQPGMNGGNGATGTNGTGTAKTSASNGTTSKMPSSVGTSSTAARATGANPRTGAAGSAGSAAMRQRVQARRSQRRYQVKRAWYQGPMALILAVVGVLVIVGIIIVIGVTNGNHSASAHGNVPPNVLNAVEHPNAAIFDQVGAGTSDLGIKALPNTSGTDLPPQNGKPVLFYAGGEYCPFCAANRWSLVMALSRFGTFSGLQTNASMTGDVYPGTPTFTFVKATYTSQYLAFDAKEIAGSSQNIQLQTMTPAETKVFGTYDAPPYSSTPGGIPFIDFGGQYMTSGAAYDVGVLHVNPTDQYSNALSYDQIISGLSNASNPIAQAIVGTANEYTAAICKMTNDSNKAVCSSSTIQSLESKLPQR